MLPSRAPPPPSPPSSPTALQPREYQQKIAEVASESNTLVVLPTGLGKTMIAILVARKRLEMYPNGKVVLLAPTKPLVQQHFNTFKDMLSLQPADHDMVLLTGENDPEERSFLWRSSRFIFATPQTVRNDVRAARVDLNDVALMVFDEAHRSVKDYSYTQLAKLYKEQAWTPLIMGLTASPGGSKEQINEIMRNLFIERVEARNEEDDDVKRYVEQTKFEGLRVTIPEQYDQVVGILREVYNEKITTLTESGFLPRGRLSKKILLQSRNAMVSKLRAAGQGGVGRGYIYGALIAQAQAVMVLHALELIETQDVSVLLKYLVRLRERPEQGKSASALLKDQRWLRLEDEAKRIESVDHPKLTKMLEIVKEQLADKQDSRIIIFTQYRDTIERIVQKLSQVGVTSNRFVGQSNKSDSEGMDQRTQTDVIDRFRGGRFSVLVSSSIGEEGLHIPDVDLVIFYEAVPSEIRAIQRKGRTGRTRPGRVVVLLAEGTVDEAYYFSSLNRERSMKSLVSSGMGAASGKENKKNDKKKEDKSSDGAKTKAPTLLDYM